MYNLKEIQAPVAQELEKFSQIFASTLSSEKKEVREIIDYIIKIQGKQMRPLFLLLTASMLGKVTDKSYIASSLIEIMHTASLVHDDIVDEAYQRRGKWSVKALWRSKKAVLIGDYIFARGVKLAVDHQLFDVICLIANVIEEMSSGELVQAESSVLLNTTRESYFEVIRCKTASLLSACSCAGAMSVDASKEDIDNMSRFGELVGLAFQIKDDILDFTVGADIGKPLLNDIKEHKITLPLIEALAKVDEKQVREIMLYMHDVDDNPGNLGKILSFVKENRGIEMAYDTMMGIKNEALVLLDRYPESEYKEALIKFTGYVLEREK